MMPNFLIVGAPKCGTTSLYRYLKTHPDVFLPDLKEPLFFAAPEIDAAPIKKFEDYKALFPTGSDYKAVGEASAWYLFHPEAPGRIRKYLGGDVKIVAILRNPVDMMFSLYQMRRRFGLEKRDVETALRPCKVAEEVVADSLSDQEYVGKLYAVRGHYAAQLERYFRQFGRDNVHVMIFEEFFADIETQYGDLCRFLGIASHSVARPENHNKGYVVRSVLVERFMSRVYPKYIYPIARHVSPQGLRGWLGGLIRSTNLSEEQVLSPELRGKLEETMRPVVRELEVVLGKPLTKVWF